MSSPRGLCDRDRCRAPVKRGKMTGAISLFFSLWPFRLRVFCIYVEYVCQRVRERKRESMRQTEKARQREREPLGSNKSGLHWTGGSCVGRQVSIAFRGRGYGRTHQSSLTHNTRTHTHTHTDAGRAEITQRQNPFPPPVPHYHVTVLCFIFGFVLNVKYCCDQIMGANSGTSSFCKQFTIDYSAAHCVSLCFALSL